MEYGYGPKNPIWPWSKSSSPSRSTAARWPRDGDGRVSAREFVQALRQVVANGGAVLPSQALALYRTAAEQGDALVGGGRCCMQTTRIGEKMLHSYIALEQMAMESS